MKSRAFTEFLNVLNLLLQTQTSTLTHHDHDDRLFEASFARVESSASNAGVTAIPFQFKITKEILRHWQPFQDLKFQFVGSRRHEQLSSRYQPRIVATVEESVPRMEIVGLESQEEDASQRVLFCC